LRKALKQKMSDIFSKKESVVKKHTEESIVKILRKHYNQGYTYRINNAFIYGYDWECDFFCVNKEGYAYEFEVKISLADFRSDFQKYKHLLFKKIDKKGVLIPNRFYYVVPDGMVAPADIPKYAGLIYIVNTHAKVIKRAPLLHKVKRDYRRILCDKFYERYIQQRRDYAASIYNITLAKTWFENLKHNFNKHEIRALRGLGFLK
jgi:hypothetical protein